MKLNFQSNTIFNDEIEKKNSIKKSLKNWVNWINLSNLQLGCMRHGQPNKKQIQC
jgi:hypothetical protein